LGAIKNVGEGPLEVILKARNPGGPFVGVTSFCSRVDLRQVNKRALESLIKAGALDGLCDRAKLLAIMDRMLTFSDVHHRASSVGQLTFYAVGSGASDESGLVADQVLVPPIPLQDKLAWEKELIGVYVSEHPLQYLRHKGSKDCIPLAEVDGSLKGHKVIVGGMASRVRRVTTRKGDEMAFVELEDLSGSMDIVVFPKTYRKHRQLLREDQLLKIRGKVEVRNGGVQVIADSVRSIVLGVADNSSAAERSQLLEVSLHCGEDREGDVRLLRKVYQILQERPGSDHFRFNIISDQGRVQLEFPNVTTRFDPELATALQEALGKGALQVRTIGA
jgi:DNA polymerase-3 subunit alpha